MSNVIEVNVVTGQKTTRDMTAAEKQFVIDSAPSADDKLVVLREERNRLLKETDWMAGSDVTMSNDWKTYRQELRDITKTFKSIGDKDFAFPTKPS